MRRHKTVDDFLDNAEYWPPELARLRKILQSTGLEETVKWGSPVYTHAGKNIVGIGGFKSYFGLWFFQGALLPDPKKVLLNAQQGKTKALRQWRMTSATEIKATTIKSYVKQAIALVDAGREIKPDMAKPIQLPLELKTALAKDKTANAAFQKLTKGRQARIRRIHRRRQASANQAQQDRKGIAPDCRRHRTQ